MMDYDCRSSEKRLAAVENDWLTAKDFALAALDLKTGAAGTEGR